MKKSIILVILCIVVAFAASARSRTETSPKGDLPDAHLVNPKGTTPIAKEKVTLSVFSDWADRVGMRPMRDWLAEEMNIDIEWAIESRDGIADKLMMKFASDNLDDIVDMGGFARELTNSLAYADDGYFYPISDLFAEYGDSIPEWVADEPAIFDAIRAPDGKIYGIPWRPIAYDDEYATRLIIEQSWLDNLGLDMPTTIDEYFDVLIAFRDNDANNNGDPNDEIPFSSCTARVMTNPFSNFWTPFIDHYEWMQVQNGKVSSAATREGFRDALRFMNRLWEEDLVYPDSFSQARGTQWQVNEASNDYNVIGSTIGQHVNYTCSWNSTKWQTYRYAPPLKGPAGVNTIWRAPQNVARMETIISAKTEYPATAYRFVDWAASEEGHLYRYYGFEGINYQAAIQGELNVAGEQAVWTAIENPPAKYRDWGLYHFLTPYGGTRHFHDLLFSVLKDPDNLSTDGKTKKEMLFESTFVQDYPHNDDPADIWPANMIFPSAVEAEFGVLKTKINRLIGEAAAKFVIGELGLDKDWDTFQSNLKSAGLDRYLEICQEAWDARNM